MDNKGLVYKENLFSIQNSYKFLEMYDAILLASYFEFKISTFINFIYIDLENKMCM